MALYAGISGPRPDSKDQYFRTNTKLQVSQHNSPGQKFKIDPRLPRLFRYHFSGDGYVVIPKGRVVAPARDGGANDDGQYKDPDLDGTYNALTLANGGVNVTETGRDGDLYVRLANKPIGVAYANLMEEFLDGFNGMQPTVENEIMIQLPYIQNKSDAEETHWGSFYDVDLNSPVKAGDFVMSDENGRVIKADFDKAREKIATAANLEELKEAQIEESRLREQVIGQVWGLDLNMPADGWLKWVSWSEDESREDEARMATGLRPQDQGADGEFPGYPYVKSYKNFDPKSSKYYPQGIPGLTNGSRIEVPFENVEIGVVQPGHSGRMDFIIIQTPFVEGTLEVKVNGQVVQVEHADPVSGRVVMNVENPGNAPVPVTASFKATGQIPGVPTNRDFKGSIGAVNILLMK